MSDLDITNVRDYSMFMALSSHKQVLCKMPGTFPYSVQPYHQGIGQSVAWSNYLKEAAGKPLSQLCLDGPKKMTSELTKHKHKHKRPSLNSLNTLLKRGERGGRRLGSGPALHPK